MPIVQTYGNQRVALEPIPGVRKTAAETPISEGAGVAAQEEKQADTLASIGAMGARLGEKQYTEIQQAARDQADQTALLEAQNRLATWENSRLYDPQNGALAVKGKDAMTLPETLTDEYNKVADGVEQNLSTDRQRQLFQKIRLDRLSSLDLTVRRHVFSEMQTYEGNELQALVDNSRQAAIANAQDPVRVGQELNRATDAIKASAPRLGFGPEEVTKQVDAVRSSVHVGVIDNLLENDKTKAAQIYFDGTKDQIAGDQLGKLEKALEESTLRGESQKQADAITAAGGTLAEQRDKVKQIADPKLRDEVMQRVDQESVIQDRSAREQLEGTLKGAYDVVDRTHDVTKIPPAVWTALPGSSRNALRDYADQLNRGIKTQTDPVTYYGALRRAGDNPTAFAAENLLTYRGKLDDADFKQLADLQLTIRNGDRKKAEEQLAGFMTNDQIVKRTLDTYGIESEEGKQSPATRKAVGELYRLVDQRIGALQQATGKKATNADVQQTLDDILSQSKSTPGSFWGLLPGGGPFFDKTTRLINTVIGDVPKSDRTQIENALRKAGRPVTDDSILNLYIETQSRLKGGGGR